MLVHLWVMMQYGLVGSYQCLEMSAWTFRLEVLANGCIV